MLVLVFLTLLNWAGPPIAPAFSFPCAVLIDGDARPALEHALADLRALGADHLIAPLGREVDVRFKSTRGRLRFGAQVSRVTGRARLVIKGRARADASYPQTLWDLASALNAVRRFESVFSPHRPVWDRGTPRGLHDLWPSIRDRRERLLQDIARVDAEMFGIFEHLRARDPSLRLPRRDPGRFTVWDLIFDPFGIPGRDHRPSRVVTAADYGWRYHAGWTRAQLTRIGLIVSTAGFLAALPHDARMAWTIYQGWDRLAPIATDVAAAERTAREYRTKQMRALADRLLAEYAANPGEELGDSLFYLYEREAGSPTFRAHPLETFVRTQPKPSATP